MRGWMLAGVMSAVVLTGQVLGQDAPEPPASLDEAMQRAEREREEMKAHALQAVASGDPMHAVLALDAVRDVLPDDAELKEAMETLRGPAVEAALKRARRLGEMGRHREALEMLAPVYVATGDERVGAALKEARFWAAAGRDDRGGGWRDGGGGHGVEEGDLRRVKEHVDRVVERLERLEGKFSFTGRAEPAVDELRRATEDNRREMERLSTDLRRELDSLSREVMSLRREVDRLRR